MRSVSSVLIILALFLISVACSNDDGPSQNDPEEYLLFGRFSLFCDDCDKRIYKLTRTSLAYDTFQSGFNWSDYSFNQDGTSPESDHSNAIQLLDLLPGDLRSINKDILGCPDCADQGGYYLEFPQNGEIKKVVIDTSDSDDQTEDIVAYKNAMQIILALMDN